MRLIKTSKPRFMPSVDRQTQTDQQVQLRVVHPSAPLRVWASSL